MKLDTANTTQKPSEYIGQLLAENPSSSKMAILFVGHRLGYYRELAESDGLTEHELADRTSNRVDFVREWLQQQAVDGVITVIHPSNRRDEPRYQLRLEYRSVLTSPESSVFLRGHGMSHEMKLKADPVVNHWLQSAPLPAADREGARGDRAGSRVKRAMRRGIGDVMNSLKMLRPRIQGLSTKS